MARIDIKSTSKNNNNSNSFGRSSNNRGSNGGGSDGGSDNKKCKKYSKKHYPDCKWYKLYKLYYRDGDNICFILYLKLLERFRQYKTGVVIIIAAAVTFIFISVEALIRNPIEFKFNFEVIGIIMVEEPVEKVVGINTLFVQSFIYDNVFKDLGILYYLFNNFK